MCCTPQGIGSGRGYMMSKMFTFRNFFYHFKSMHRSIHMYVDHVCKIFALYNYFKKCPAELIN